jgi:hypothetical protein
MRLQSFGTPSQDADEKRGFRIGRSTWSPDAREQFPDCRLEFRIRDLSALCPIECILPAMFQIGGFMLRDQFNNAGPEP